MKSFAWAEARLILSNIKKPVMGVCAGAMCVLGGVLHQVPHLSPPHTLGLFSFCTFQSKANLGVSAGACCPRTPWWRPPTVTGLPG